jgi:hypothetical protein
MNRFLVLFISIIVGLRVYSQEKLFFSVDASPLLSYRTYKLIDYSSGNSTVQSGKVLYNDFKHYYDSIESPKYGYKISINIGYSLTDKLSVLSGIIYKKIGYKTNSTLTSGQYNANGGILHHYSSNNDVLDLYSNLFYIGIPVGLQYKIYSVNKFDIGLSIGSSFDLLINHDTKDIDYPNIKPRDYYSDYSNFAINIDAGVEFGYMINSKFEVYLMPHFADYITSNVKINYILSDDLYVKINQYNYYCDFKFGFRYKI